jgi:hypothetical protein
VSKLAARISGVDKPVKRLDSPGFIQFVNKSDGESSVVQARHVFAETHRNRRVKIKLFRHWNGQLNVVPGLNVFVVGYNLRVGE